MGSIGGDLDVLGMANLIQAVTASQREGRLTLTRDGETKIIQCGPGGLRLLEGTRRVSPLGQILVRTRKLTRGQLADVLAGHGKSGLPLGAYVTQKGLLSRDDIDKALADQAADEIYDLFTWTQGRFEYVESEGSDEAPGDGILSSVRIDRSVMFLALEAARRMDHLARIREVIPGERLVPVAMEIPLAESEVGLDRDSLQEILPFVDGRRSVERIIEESLYSKFTVLMTLHALAQHGAVKIRDVGASDGPETVRIRRPSGHRNGPGPDAPTILLMGDDAPARLPLSLYLGHSGFAVIECPTSENLPRLLARTSAAAIMLDQDIGSDAGLALCRRVAQSKVPVIVLTSLEADRTIPNAFLSDARRVLLKPVNSELLLERVRELLLPPVVVTEDRG